MGAYNCLGSSDSVDNIINFKKTHKGSYQLSACELYLPQTNGEVSDSITQNWTQQAVECYSLKSDCKNCSIGKGNYSFVCQMHKIVDELLKIKGEPNPSDFLFD